jgi:hypothetical protein
MLILTGIDKPFYPELAQLGIFDDVLSVCVIYSKPVANNTIMNSI